MQIQAKRIWLIGASEGIGRSLAKQLVEAGARVLATARNESRLMELSEELASENFKIAPADGVNLDSLQRAYNTALSSWGGVDMVIYNAGVYSPMPLENWSLATALSTMDVNVQGAMRMIDVVLPDMMKNHRGHIVMVSSVASYRGLPESAAYGASKAALTNFTEYLKIEGKKYNIAVQLVSPGFVKTRLTEQNNFAMPAMIDADMAAQRITSGLRSETYDIHFPKRFSWAMKLLRIIPHAWYFWIIGKIKL